MGLFNKNRINYQEIQMLQKYFSQTIILLIIASSIFMFTQCKESETSDKESENTTQTSTSESDNSTTTSDCGMIDEYAEAFDDYKSMLNKIKSLQNVSMEEMNRVTTKLGEMTANIEMKGKSHFGDKCWEKYLQLYNEFLKLAGLNNNQIQDLENMRKQTEDLLNY